MMIHVVVWLIRKQREEREAERQSRLRLAKRLEVLRPTASVSGKQDCAETTPVMFDIVSSNPPFRDKWRWEIF